MTNIWNMSRGLRVPRWPGPLWKITPNAHFWSNHRVWVCFLRKSIFCVFKGLKKTFLSLQNLIWTQKPYFWGGHILKLFDLSNGFKVINFKIAIFWPNLPWISPKLWPRSKSFRSMTTPKVRFLRPSMVLGAQKSFFGPQKTQKNWFSKKIGFIWFGCTL